MCLPSRPRLSCWSLSRAVCVSHPHSKSAPVNACLKNTATHFTAKANYATIADLEGTVIVAHSDQRSVCIQSTRAGTLIVTTAKQKFSRASTPHLHTRKGKGTHTHKKHTPCYQCSPLPQLIDYGFTPPPN